MSSKEASSSSCGLWLAEMLEALSAATRVLVYASALTGAGIALVQSSLRCGDDGGIIPLDRLTRLSGLVLAVTSGLGAVLLLERLGGVDDLAAQAALFRSTLGAAFAFQFVGGTLLAANDGTQARQLGAAAILLSFGIVGHAASRGLGSSAAVLVHVSAVAWWLGGLWVLLYAGKKLEPDDFAHLTIRFSQQAIWFVGMLALAGVVTAALLLEFRFDLAQRYTQLILAKAGILIGLLALAGINRFMLTPRLAAKVRARRWFRRSMGLEMLLIFGIFAATAWLTTTVSPHAADNAESGRKEQVQVGEPITVIDPWAPAMFSGAQTAAGYMVIVNRQPVEDRLLSATSPWAENVTLHATRNDGGVSKMQDLSFMAIPAGQRIALTQGVYHLMFTGLYAPFVEGDDVPVTLQFARAGKVEVKLKVHRFGEIGEVHDHEH